MKPKSRDALGLAMATPCLHTESLKNTLCRLPDTLATGTMASELILIIWRKTQNYKHLATTTWCKIKREKHLATRVLGATLAPTSVGQATVPEAFVLQVFDIFLIIWNGFVLKCDFLKICPYLFGRWRFSSSQSSKHNLKWKGKVWRKLTGQKPFFVANINSIFWIDLQ